MLLFYEKYFFPYYVKPNLAPPKQTCASSWILNLEFKQKYFWASQAHCKQDIPRHFLYKKNLDLTVASVYRKKELSERE
jgi:hypothetical protein